MTQITFTDDALVPKCITFGGTPVVRWYAYIRSAQSYNIYLQRSVDAVLSAEVFTVEANPPAFGALQPGISYFNFIADPADPTKARLYFLSDGTLFCITVTSTPVGEQPTLQQFDRVNNRADTVIPALGVGAVLSPTTSFGAIPTPTLVHLRSSTPGNRILVIGPLNGPTERYFAQVVEVYRAPNQGNAVLYDTLFVGPVPQLVLEVPEATGGNTELWHARSLNIDFGTRSNFAHTWDNGDVTGEANAAQPLGLGSPLTPSLVKLSKKPIKINRQEPDQPALQLGLGSPLTPSLVKLSKVPIKIVRQEPDQPALRLGLGAPLTPTVTKLRVV